jgi:hypothetical protein
MAALTPFAVYRLRRRALARGATDGREPTADERSLLRQHARTALVVLFAFWIVTSVLVTMQAVFQAPPSLGWAGFVPISVLGATWVSAQLRVMCPTCRYPLGYQKPFGVPARCERCGAVLSISSKGE